MPAATNRAGIFRNIGEAQNRERRLLIKEISKVKGLMPLMMKPRNGMRWTEEERAELLMQLRALPRMIATLVRRPNVRLAHGC